MLSLGTYLTTLGHPAPSWSQYIKDMQVIATHFDEPRAIYVWGFNGGTEPIAVVLPWDVEKAKDAHEAQGEAGEAGVPMVMGWSEGEYVFYPAPVEPLPEKE
jgi:hypothetical protein